MVPYVKRRDRVGRSTIGYTLPNQGRVGGVS